MPSFDSRLREIHPKTPVGWRSWLQDNHATLDGVWLTYYRTSTGRRRLTWEDAVREALCFGWIDSKVVPIDEERYKQVFTPRKPTSVWSKINKQHVDALTEAGLMTEAGQRAVDIAKENGAWTILDPVDDLVVPPDLKRELRASPTARLAYDALSDSQKRTILRSLYTAKREATRVKRLDDALASLQPSIS
ncbi:MAG: YdeI/OmpD-associated family protein [Acidimicrobiales bacterium]|nr:YdeI/OmpD-associated family protein [Acidimicrobiales bacterium]